MQRLVLGVGYRGQAYQGWQSQAGRNTVQDHLEAALSSFAAMPVRTVCAGRTDAGVHALNQVVHADITVERPAASWVRGTNRFLPADIAVQWCRTTTPAFHARFSALGRRYVYLILQAPTRPALEVGSVGWCFRPLNGDAMRNAAARLQGEHDFSAFRSSQCQAASPVKTIRSIAIHQRGAYWRFEFDASAFLHHMVRNIMGCLVAVGTGAKPAGWLDDVLASRRRELAAPTFSAAGLYFVGPYYDAVHDIPIHTPAMDWLP
ncbi:MAG: tRNA pseudouridine synthase A [Methylibium sp. NZG]|nr:MAG: tRNA pseudouridine synthase A [Methylibium sp. NZG]